MVGQFRQRAPLGLALQNSIMPGDQPQFGMGDFPAQPHSYAQGPKQEKGGFFKEGGMGRTIAGLIGDALLQQGGMAPVYSPMMRQQQATKAEEAQWSRRRQEANEDWMAREQWKLANEKPEVPKFVRDVEAWQRLNDEQRKAYSQMQDAERGPITVLPNGQVYVRDPAIASQLGMGGNGGGANLDNTPTVEDGMAYTPGPGGRANPSNWKAQGGPTPSASGGF